MTDLEPTGEEIKAIEADTKYLRSIGIGVVGPRFGMFQVGTMQMTTKQMQSFAERVRGRGKGEPSGGWQPFVTETPEAPEWLATALAALDARAEALRAELDAIERARPVLWQAACHKRRTKP
jgi:hypothetical protein